jgi:hypothetical protein
MRLDLDGQLNGTSNGIDWDDLDSSTHKMNGHATHNFDQDSDVNDSASKMNGENWSDEELPYRNDHLGKPNYGLDGLAEDVEDEGSARDDFWA